MTSNQKTVLFYGPQSPSDNHYTAKARLLQSIWRVENGLQIGIGPNKAPLSRILKFQQTAVI